MCHEKDMVWECWGKSNDSQSKCVSSPMKGQSYDNGVWPHRVIKTQWSNCQSIQSIDVLYHVLFCWYLFLPSFITRHKTQEDSLHVDIDIDIDSITYHIKSEGSLWFFPTVLDKLRFKLPILSRVVHHFPCGSWHSFPNQDSHTFFMSNVHCEMRVDGWKHFCTDLGLGIWDLGSGIWDLFRTNDFHSISSSMHYPVS